MAIDRIKKNINDDKDIRPSNPSIKFTKFINAVPKNIRNIVVNNPLRSFKLIRSEYARIEITVSNWTIYLIMDLTPFLSSIMPTIAKGRDIKGTKLPKNIEKNVDEITKEIPPEVVVGNLWELLLTGKEIK